MFSAKNCCLWKEFANIMYSKTVIEFSFYDIYDYTRYLPLTITP